MKSRAVVLLSGGLDSSYNLFRAVEDHEVVLALTFDYGQRAAASEIRAAKELCSFLHVSHQSIELPWFRDFTRTGLVDQRASVPTASQVAINDLQRSGETAKAVWVPNRNGIFLNIGAAYAEGLGAKVLLTGFNAEEAVTFPDNSQGFLEALNQSLSYSTANAVKVKSYCTQMNKTEIVADAIQRKIPFQKMWPCYFSGEQLCGECESCQRFFRALAAHGIERKQLGI